MNPDAQVQELDLDALASRWQWALDAGASALDAASSELPAQLLVTERARIARERQTVAALLSGVAADHHATAMPWLAPGPVTPRLLGLPDGTEACMFDLDGVLTDSAALHAAAWAEALDPFLLGISQRATHDTGWQFVPFDRDIEYRMYFDGRPRLEGLHLFLAGRGLGITEELARELARRKGDLLEHGLQRKGVAALAGAHAYLQAVGHARLGRAVVSASTTTLPMLQLANLDRNVEVRVDAETMRTDNLRSRPAPDILLDAARKLGIEPKRTVSLTHSDAGVAAAHGAGIPVIGVATGAAAERLRGFGAELVVSGLSSLLDPRLGACALAAAQSRAA
jgi:HAD superfamily hydrolase (TIGR01509 family)